MKNEVMTLDEFMEVIKEAVQKDKDNEDKQEECSCEEKCELCSCS